MPEPTRRLEVEDQGDVTVVKFVDPRITDEQVIKAIGDQLFQLIDLGRHKQRLDFASVEIVASAMLGKLLSLHKKLKAVNGELVLCNLNEDLMDALETSRLVDFFQIDRG